MIGQIIHDSGRLGANQNMSGKLCIKLAILSCNHSDMLSFFILLTGITPGFFLPAYAASKFGVVGYTRSWAVSKNFILTS